MAKRKSKASKKGANPWQQAVEQVLATEGPKLRAAYDRFEAKYGPRTFVYMGKVKGGTIALVVEPKGRRRPAPLLHLNALFAMPPARRRKFLDALEKEASRDRRRIARRRGAQRER
ncbi:MAG: hypothetical protein HY721_10285 [Planctomycetes bacterium]|nr:hypothetical protein [Planctomycetota bacterium]